MFCIEALGEKSAATKSSYVLVARGDGPYTVGRQDSSTIIIGNNDVSRQHATLEVISFRDFLRQAPGAYDHYSNSERVIERRAALEALLDRQEEVGADGLDEILEHNIDEQEEALMFSLVLCVRHYSKTGSTEIRISRPLDEIISTAEATALQQQQQHSSGRSRASSMMSPATRSRHDSTINHGDDDLGAKLKNGPMALSVSSVAYIPAFTDDLYSVSFGSKAHFKVTFRPLVVAVSQLHFSPEYVGEMSLMFRQLGCTVLADGNPTPDLRESSFQREIVNRVGFVGTTVIEEKKHTSDLSSLGAGGGTVAPFQQSKKASTAISSSTLFARPIRPEIFLNPISKIHICEEIDDSASVLNALSIGYMLALPVYIFELFAIVAAEAARPLHSLPHPSKSVGGASAEPQKKREVYGSAVYHYPDSVACPFSLYPIPASSSANRSRLRLFNNRKFYIPNPLAIRKNQASLLMSGASRPLYLGLQLLPPPNAGTSSEKILKEQSNPNAIGFERSPSRGDASSRGTSYSPTRAKTPNSPLSPTGNYSPLTAGSYVVVTPELELVIKELFTVAQARYANYQRYPMAVMMSHPQLMHVAGEEGHGFLNVLPVVEEELRATAMAVHRGYIPITERSLHVSLITNKFIPEVVDEFVVWCVDEQRQAGLHLKGLEANESAANMREVEQRRELLSVMFGEILADDPASVEQLLQQHNDSLFAQLSADKASRYAVTRNAVMEAGPANLGGGLLRHTEIASDDPLAYLDGNARVTRRSLPIPNTEFALPHHEGFGSVSPTTPKVKSGRRDPYNEIDSLGRVRATVVDPAAKDPFQAQQDEEDFDSDATPSDLDSVDHELNKVHIKGYHTQRLADIDDFDQFNRALADARKASEGSLQPEIEKVTGLFRLVENKKVVLAGGGQDAHANYSFNSSSPERNTNGTRRPSANIPMSRTTVSGHTVTYLTSLLNRHVLPQLERLETCALARESRNGHAAVQALWDEADTVRAMVEEILANHNREVGKLNPTTHQQVMAARSRSNLYGYVNADVPLGVDTSSNEYRRDNSSRRSNNTNSPYRKHASSGYTVSIAAVAGSTSSIQRGPAPTVRTQHASTVAYASSNRTQSPAVIPKAATKNNLSTAFARGKSGSNSGFNRSATGVSERAVANDASGYAPAPYAAGRNYDSLNTTLVADERSIHQRQSVPYPTDQSYEDSNNIVLRTKNALSFESSMRNTTTPTRRTQTNTSLNSAEQRNARYAPLPLFAAQKVHKSQAMQATTARVLLAGDVIFTDSDPTKIHLTGEERVDATLHEKIESFDTAGVARRRQLFLYRYGGDEGNKRFTMWLNSQPSKWTRELHRTLEHKNLKFSDLLDAKYAW